MENIFVLIVLFAGAAVALLGFFLVASEKELKVKRREIEELLNKLENAPEGSSPVQMAPPQPDHSGELADLRAQNQDLQNQVSALAGKLELSRRSIQEMETAEQNAQNGQAESQQLRAANDQLTAELNDLRSRLQSSETHSAGSAAQNQDAAERHAQLQSEIMDLKQKLQESHAKLRELEGVQQKVAHLDTLEAEQREERQKLQGRIADLEREVSSNQEKVREMAALQERLAQSEHDQATLREESQRHDQEIARWRERIAEGEENRRRLAVLQAPYEQLLSKQSSLADQQREFQGELAAFAKLMAPPAQENHSAGSSASVQSDRSTQSKLSGSDSRENSASPVVALTNSQDSGARSQADLQEYAAAAPKEKAKRRFGIFSAVILLAASGLLAAKFFSSNSTDSTVPVVSASAVKISDRATTPVAPQVNAALQVKAIEPPAVSEPQPAKETPKPINETSRPRQITKQEMRIAGTYQITQASRVYAGPTESSQLIGEIEPGMKVNVVNNRDGWLEIHSKHGRPPGFIRRDVATRVTGQN